MASAPSGVSAVAASGSQINVSWSNNGPYTALYLWWKIDGGSYASISLSASATSYNKIDLTDGKKYYFYVAAEWNAGLDGGSSSIVNATTTLTNPTGAAATPGEDEVALTWSYSGTGAESMNVYRGSTLIATLAGSARSYTAIGLSEGVSYTFTIKAYTSAYGLTTGTSVTTTTLNMPELIGGATLTVLGTTSIKIDWTSEVDCTRVYIQYKEADGTYTTPSPAYVAAGVKTYTLTGLKYKQLYYVRLIGWNANGYGPYTTAMSATTDDHSAWVKLDLGAGIAWAINQVKFKVPANNFNGFTIHGSNDGSAWTLLHTDNAANTTDEQTFSFTNTTIYRYVKLTNTSNHARNAMKIYTFKAYSSPPSAEYLQLDCGAGVTKTPSRLIIQPNDSGVENFELFGSNDASAWTSLTSGKCISGSSENEFTFVNSTAYRYFRLYVSSCYSGVNIAVLEWKLQELATIVDTNYYLLRRETSFDILRRVIFSDYDSMVAFVAAWEAANPSWDHAAFTIATTDVSTANDTITITGHALKDNDRVTYYVGGGAAIGGLTADTNYYVIVVDANTIQLAASWGGSAIDLTGTGNNTQALAPSAYWLNSLTIDDFYDNAEVAEKITAVGDFSTTETKLNSYSAETVSAAALVSMLSDETLFGIPAAYQASVSIDGPTSLHELKIRALKQEFVSGSWQDAEPKEYVLTKNVFTTAGANLYKANLNSNGDISGFEIIYSALKATGKPFWCNYQNRAFMVNGTEDDSDKIWTDGDGVYQNGIDAPVVVANGTVFTLAQTDIDISTDEITIAAHGLYNQQRVVYANGGGSDAGGLTDGTTYYVIVVDANTIKLSATAGGAAIDLTSDGTTDDQTLTTTSITQSASGGSMSDGDYYIKLRYYRSTYGGCNSNFSDEISITLSGGGSSQSIVLDVLRSSDEQVDWIYVFRTKLLDAVYYKAAEIANTAITDTVTQITLTLSDNSLGAQDLAEEYDPPPNSKQVITFGGINRLGYLVDDGLYFSTPGHGENVPPGNFIPIGKDDGQNTVAVCATNDWAIVWKDDSMYAIDLNNIEELESICISGTIGLIDPKAYALIEDGQAVMFATKVGFCITNGVKVTNLSRGHSSTNSEGQEETIGRNLDDYVNNFDHSRKDETCAVFFPKRQLFICKTPYKGEDEYGRGNIRLWCYDVIKGCFFKWEFPINPIRLFLLSDENDIPRLVASFVQLYSDEYYGYFMELDDRDEGQDVISITHAGVEKKQDIAWELATCWSNLGLVERNKVMRMLFAQIYATGKVDINIEIGIDHKRYRRGTLVELSSYVSAMSHEGETGTAPTEGRDELEGFDYGRVKTLGIPVDAVGTDFAMRLYCSTSEYVKLLEFAQMFRLRGGRPNP